MTAEEPRTPLASRARLNAARSAALVDWCAQQYTSQPTRLVAEAAIARRLGANVDSDGSVAFGFWVPELLDHRVPDGDVFLELLAPGDELDLERSQQTMAFQRLLLPVSRHEALAFAVVDGLQVGTRERVGDFYALSWRDSDGREHRICDPLAASVPFGTFAPAEILDTQGLHRDRTDRAYYEQLAAAAGDAIHKFGTAHQHPAGARADGHRRRYPGQPGTALQRIAERLRRDLPLEDGDELYMGYDAVQLLPVEPTTVYETGPSFWQEFSRDESHCHVDPAATQTPRTGATTW
jgi:hypothetical protein